MIQATAMESFYSAKYPDAMPTRARDTSSGTFKMEPTPEKPTQRSEQFFTMKKEGRGHTFSTMCHNMFSHDHFVHDTPWTLGTPTGLPLQLKSTRHVVRNCQRQHSNHQSCSNHDSPQRFPRHLAVATLYNLSRVQVTRRKKQKQHSAEVSPDPWTERSPRRSIRDFGNYRSHKTLSTRRRSQLPLNPSGPSGTYHQTNSPAEFTEVV